MSDVRPFPAQASPLRGLRIHPLREALDREIHARPPEELRAPVRATHLALLPDPDRSRDEHAHIAALCRRLQAPEPAADAVHVSVDCGAFRLKWERHSEFSAYTFYVPGPFDSPFAEPPIARVPADWLAALGGEVIVATHVALEPSSTPMRETAELRELFGTNNIAGAEMLGRRAVVWSDYRIHPDGFSRVLIRDWGLRERQAGRLVQRLLDIETYRTMAMLGFPLARETGAELTDSERRLSELTARLTDVGGLAEEQAILAELSQLAAETERLSAASSYRFAASRAYHALVARRIAELRETRIEGLQTVDEFMDRRFSPAMRTVESVRERQEQLSRRVSRAATLLRTRVDVALEQQNRDLLVSMNRRARLQLRLQETVEGLSVVVLAYYLVSLCGYGFKALAKAGVGPNPELATGAAVPFALAAVWLGVRRLRKRLGGNGEH